MQTASRRAPWWVPVSRLRLAQRLGALLAALVGALPLAGCSQRTELGPPPGQTEPAGGLGWPAVEDVVAQLEGGNCRFGVDALDSCQPRAPRGMFGWLLHRQEDRWTCPTGAARCLAKMGPAAQTAVPALLRALESGPPDYDTGDGLIPVRSSVIEALGRSGDVRAVAPLGRALSDPAYAFVTLMALRDLGPLAHTEVRSVASVLDARIADAPGREKACRDAVKQLEQHLALKAIEQRLQHENPHRTRAVIPSGEFEAAVRALDRGSAGYLTNREGACRDHVGGMALQALAAFRCEACTMKIVEALRDPAVAQDAAWQLYLMAEPVPGAAQALRAVVESPSHGPLAKDAARSALGAVGERGR